MQKLVAILFVFLFTFVVNAQTGGVKFQLLSNWKQVKARAKQENKYIFVDFYATWCGPCKAMDKDVYPSDNLGIIANDKFISIRIQQDKTSSDNVAIKSWYADADSLTKVFNITSLPTLLFFSPDAELINKTAGYQDETRLVALFDNALATKTRYQAQVKRYRQNNLPHDEMANLALKAQEIGSTQLADSIARDYEISYLYRLSDSLLFTKKNIKFITSFPIASNDRVFNLFYKNPKRGDELTRTGYSEDIVNYTITKEEIESKLFYQGNPIVKKPDWTRIRNSITEKYGVEYANLLASLSAEIAFYGKIQDWKKYANLINDAIKRYPPEANGYKFANVTMIGAFFQRDDWNLNSGAWNIFLHCNDKSILRTALKWSNLSISVAGNDNGISPIDQYYDTKANLLYKIGRIQEAIDAERLAYEIAKSNAQKQGRKDGGDGYLATIEKMKEGTPTWKISN
jgi:thioredoxin-related protein